MDYLNWNNLISSALFSQKNAGKDVYIYLSKNDIIGLGKAKFQTESEENIWSDYILSIKNGIPGSSGNIACRAKYCYEKRHLSRINMIELTFPPYISYLVFLVLPLIETIDEVFNANNYFGRLNRFLKTNLIDQKIGTPDFRDNNINLLWTDLENWSVSKRNGNFGFFKVVPFTNLNWIYAGKPLSQCVLPPRAFLALPELFLRGGLIPNSFYSETEIKQTLLAYGPSILHLKGNIVELIKNSESNELGESILRIVKREYSSWTGETVQLIEPEIIQKTKRSYTVASFFLQFKVNELDESINFSYRMYSSNEYPEDLKLQHRDNLYETNGWSKTMNLPFKSSFEFIDDFNKWVVRFPEKDVRLFVSAANYQLSNSFWLETPILSKTDVMYLLCKNHKRDLILQWGNSFKIGTFSEAELEGVPDNFSIFKFSRPTKSLPEIPILTLYEEKVIKLIGGLKIKFRVFIDNFLPEIEVVNSTGDEKVYLQYRNTKERLPLQKQKFFTNRWSLPSDILKNLDFFIKIDEDKVAGNEISYSLVSADCSSRKIVEDLLPKRDSFGRSVSNDLHKYCIGSNVINAEMASQRAYSPWANLFLTLNEELLDKIAPVTITNNCGNLLASFLTLKAVLTTEEFYEAFEFYYSKEFYNGDANYLSNLTRVKKTAINFYDYIGFLDYDYEAKKIVINPPQLIFIPSSKGKKVLLIGGRDEYFINSVIATAPKFNLQVEITRQLSSNNNLLLPDVITIKAFGKATTGSGEGDILAFARVLNLKFSQNEFIQIALQLFSASIAEYEKELFENNEVIQDNYEWARKSFNPDNLKYEKSLSVEFDKLFSLVEYKFNEYTFYNRLWKDGKCYQVDKNWGRYLALKHCNKSIILFDSDRKRVAVPSETPLPRLLSESLMLLSGLAPNLSEIDGRYYRVYENIPGVFTNNLFLKLGQIPIKKQLI